MPEIKKKRAPSVDSNQRAWTQVYDDMNDVINSVNQKSAVESRNGASGLDGDIRLFKDVDKTKYFIEGKFSDGWAKRELLFSDLSNETQDESINYLATESYVKPDGTVPFTAKQSGIAPTNAAHLSTKGYTDVGRLVSVTKSTNDLVFGMTDTASNITFTGFGTNAYTSTTIPTTFVSALTNSPGGQTLIAASTGELYRLGGGENITITTDAPPAPNDAETWVQIDCDINTTNFVTTPAPRFGELRTGESGDPGAWDVMYDGDRLSGGTHDILIIDMDESNVTIDTTTVTIGNPQVTYDAIKINAPANTNTQNTFTSSWVDSTNDCILRLTKSGAGTGTQDIKIVAGSYITLTPSGTNLTISSVDTNTTDILSTTPTGGDNDEYFSLRDSGDTILALEQGDGISLDINDSGTGDVVTISSTVSTSGMLTDGLVIVEAWNGSEVDTTASAVGPDKLRFIDTSDITWSIDKTGDIISVTGDVDAPADNNTTYSVSIPSSTTKLRLTAGGSGSGTDDIEFVGSGATSVTRTTADKFTISSANTVYPGIETTNDTDETGTYDIYTLVDDPTGTSTTVRALMEGEGINIEEDDGGDGGDVLKISSTVSAGLSNGLVRVESYETAGEGAITSNANASGGDTFRFIDTDEITWAVTGPSSNIITVTPDITFPADTNTVTSVREDSGTYRTGNITLQSGTNVTITEPSTGVFDIASADQYTGTVTGTGSANKYARWTGGSALEYRSNAQVRSDLGIADNEIIDWTVDQGTTVVHSGNYTDTNTVYPGIQSTNDTDESSTLDIYTLVDDPSGTSTTIRALMEGDGINMEVDDGGDGGDLIKISSTVSAGLTNGLVSVDSYETDGGGAITSGPISASGGDRLRFIDTDEITWNVTGPSGDIITVTPDITFPADSNTTYSAGALLDMDVGTRFDVDLSEATDMTEAWVTGSDEFIVLDSGVQKRKLSSEIFGSNAFNSTAFTTNTGTVTGTGSTGYYARWTGTSGLEGRTTTQVRSDLGIADNEIIDWTTDQGSTNIHSGNYTNTVYPGISSTNATTSSGHPDVYTLVEDSDTVRALMEGTGINMEVADEGSGGNVIKISSSVSAGLTNGLVRVESWETDGSGAITSNVNASGGDTLRLVDAGIVTWAVTGSGDIISVTPTFDLSGYATSGHNHSGTYLPNKTIGIDNDNLVEIDHASVENNDYAKFTANGLEGRSYAEVLSDIGAAASSHNHNSSYYTESEMDTKLALKANLAGCTFTSNVNFNGSTTNYPDACIGGTGRIVASSAVLQCKGFIRVAQYVFIHESSTSSNSVGWKIDSNNLTLQSEGTGQKNLHIPNDVIAYYSSDPRLKTNIQELESPLYKLSKINGYKFDWLPKAQKLNSYNKGTSIGVMSDEIEKMYPELVHTRDNGYKAVDYEKLTAVLIAAVNDLTSKLIEKGVLDEELQSSKSCC